MRKSVGFSIPIPSFLFYCSEPTDINNFIFSLLYNEGMKERIVSNGHVLIYITDDRGTKEQKIEAKRQGKLSLT